MGDQPAQQRRSQLLRHWRYLAGRKLDDVRMALFPGRLHDTAHNARNLEIEVFWAAILAGAVNFNAAFALRLGASNAEIGYLSSIPALLALLITIPVGQLLGRMARRMPWMVWSLFLYRLGYLLVVFVPFLPIPAKGTVLVWLLIAFTAPAQVFGVAWTAMLADVIPETMRVRVFAVRNILVAVAATAAIFLAGRWLENAPYPTNYQVMYFIGFAASMVSIYYIARMKVPDSTMPAGGARPVGLRSLWLAWKEALAHEPDFVRLIGNTLAHGAGLWMIGPLYVLYFVKTLGATEGWLGLNGTLGNLTPVIGYMLWQRAIMRWGDNRVLKWTISFVGVYPIIVGMTHGLAPILALTALYGLLAPGTNLAHFDMLLKICPPADRPLYVGIYTTIMNIGAFIMPFVGIALANRFGFAPVLIAGGVMCLVGSSLFRWRPLRTADSLTARRALAMDATPQEA